MAAARKEGTTKSAIASYLRAPWWKHLPVSSCIGGGAKGHASRLPHLAKTNVPPRENRKQSPHRPLRGRQKLMSLRQDNWPPAFVWLPMAHIIARHEQAAFLHPETEAKFRVRARPAN
jgi:hypothetical protein